MKRTTYCGFVNEELLNEEIVLKGWIDNRGTWEALFSWTCATGKVSFRSWQMLIFQKAWKG